MGVFWPPAHAATGRLLALLGVVGAACALADREARRALLRFLHAQIQKLEGLDAATPALSDRSDAASDACSSRGSRRGSGAGLGLFGLDHQLPTPPETASPGHSDDGADSDELRMRLQPIPNPNAPKGSPAPRPRRGVAREHVEIETAAHDSYGFVSDPAALAAGGAARQGDHYLFVCVKCQRRSVADACEKVCSDADGVLRCRLRPAGEVDMEDLVMAQTPQVAHDGRRKTTGRVLYENLRGLHAEHERMKAKWACQQGGGCPNAVASRLRIVPVNCLAMCHLGNVIALAAPGKFAYQFGAMREGDSEDMQAILQFAEDYIESPDGFSKNRTRPAVLSRNILARIPPTLPVFTSIADE